MAYINGHEILLGTTSQIEVEKPVIRKISGALMATAFGTIGRAEPVEENEEE